MYKKINIYNRKLLKHFAARVLIYKIIVISFGIVFSYFYLHKEFSELFNITSAISKWDGESYLTIASNGYESSGHNRFLIVFFPLYPLLIALIGLVVNNLTVATILLTFAATVFALFFFYKLLILDQTKKVANHAVWLLLIFPTAYFLHIGYTESLFLALLFGSLLFARKKLWIWAGLLAFFASLTRLNGLFLFFPLLIEIALDWKTKRRFDLKYFAIFLPTLGFGIYLLINYIVAGRYDMFMVYQREHWYHELMAPWLGIYHFAKGTIESPMNYDNLMHGWIELAAIFLSIIATIWSAFKLRLSYTVWIFSNLLIITSSSFIYSTPRYILINFPIYIMLARIANKKLYWYALVLICLILQAFLWFTYSIGWWAY